MISECCNAAVKKVLDGIWKCSDCQKWVSEEGDLWHKDEDEDYQSFLLPPRSRKYQERLPQHKLRNYGIL